MCSREQKDACKKKKREGEEKRREEKHVTIDG
jgi:hypothetical protein